ncbi:MAG: four helix bundle protein [Planctomycetes bacterium]|nr:four helix bundle protein [Planctomycetota bacterium]
MEFDQDKLEAYRWAVRFVSSMPGLTEHVPRGFGFLVDQIRRAATSICLNIAEGAGEYSPKEKARFYRMARRSTTETVAVIDILHALSWVDDDQRTDARAKLDRVCAMLTTLARRMTAAGKDDAIL